MFKIDGGDKMIFASNNRGKLKEIKSIFDNYDIKGLKECGIDVDVLEDKETFYENASKKAHEIFTIAKEAVIADDSGLCVEALNDWPGVYTHRFLGDDKSDHDRNLAIIDKLKDVDNRTAYVVCNLVYYDGVREISSVGKIKGEITFEELGNNGFGFDPIFRLDNGKTLAELTIEEKNTVSARKIAAEKLKQEIDIIMEGE